MYSSLIGKIEKAKRYAQEPRRIQLDEFTLTFRGDNDAHEVVRADEHWSCNCHAFETYATCAHVMAVQRIFQTHLDAQALQPIGSDAIPQSALIGKIEKARRYSQQPERVTLSALALTFEGEHDQYAVTLAAERWHCGCHTFVSFGICSHIMATQRVFEPMLSADARTAAALAEAV